MRAVVITGSAGSSSLELRDVPAPRPGPDDLLVDVRASALNQADLRQAATHFASSEQAGGPPIAGLELTGEVAAVGDRVRGFAVGDRVMAMGGSAWAERAVVDHRLTMPVPSGLTWTEAAALPVSFLTAHDALARAAGLQRGQTVLVQGATSAAGLACVQVAQAMGAGAVLGTTSTAAKAGLLRELGAQPVSRADDDVVEVVAAATGGRGVDVVVDIVGAGVVDQNVASARVGGVVVCLGRLAGRQATLDLDEFSRKRITMVGVTFRTRTLQERIGAVERFNRECVPLLEAGQLHPVIDRTFSLAEVRAAFEHLQRADRMGKIVLTVGADR